MTLKVPGMNPVESADHLLTNTDDSLQILHVLSNCSSSNVSAEVPNNDDDDDEEEELVRLKVLSCATVLAWSMLAYSVLIVRLCTVCEVDMQKT